MWKNRFVLCVHVRNVIFNKKLLNKQIFTVNSCSPIDLCVFNKTVVALKLFSQHCTVLLHDAVAMKLIFTEENLLCFEGSLLCSQKLLLDPIQSQLNTFSHMHLHVILFIYVGVPSSVFSSGFLHQHFVLNLPCRHS